jgi:hypothetical protein
LQNNLRDELFNLDVGDEQVLGTSFTVQEFGERSVIETHCRVTAEGKLMMKCDKRVQVRNKDFIGTPFQVEELIKVVGEPMPAEASIRVNVVSPEKKQKVAALVRIDGLIRLFRRCQNPCIEDIESFERPSKRSSLRSPVDDRLEPFHWGASTLRDIFDDRRSVHELA